MTAILWLAGCAGERAPEPASILLVTLDTTRADRLGCYDYFRDTSPNLDRLAAAGILFENAYAPMATTLPSHVSLMTATNPGRHGLRGNFKKIRRSLDTSQGIPTFAEILRDAGYQTGAIVAAAPLHSSTGLSAGFASYDDPKGSTRRAEEIVDAALSWIDARQDGPFLLWLHFWDPHGPHTPSGEFAHLYSDDEAQLRRHLKARGFDRGRRILELNTDYDREIRQTDAQLGRLFEELERRGLLSELALAVVGDHGEGLGQRGWRRHGRIHDELIRVPLILKLPDHLGTKPRRVVGLASVIDVVPTLAAALRLPIPADARAGFEGIDLLANEAGRPEVFVERVYRKRVGKLRQLEDGRTAWEPGRKYALIEPGWKYVHRTEAPDQLFGLADDPFETRDVIADHPQRAAAMLARTRSILDDYARRGPQMEVQSQIDPEHRRELEALGYAE